MDKIHLAGIVRRAISVRNDLSDVMQDVSGYRCRQLEEFMPREYKDIHTALSEVDSAIRILTSLLAERNVGGYYDGY